METIKIIDRLAGQNWIDQWRDGCKKRHNNNPFASALAERWCEENFINGFSTFTWRDSPQGWNVWANRIRFAHFMDDLIR